MGITIFQAHRDSSVIYFFLSNIFVFVALFRYGLFSSFESILPRIFDNILDGIIIIDQDQLVLGYNFAAAQLLSLSSVASSFPIERGLKKYPALIKLIKLPYEFGKREQIELDLLVRGGLRSFEVS